MYSAFFPAFLVASSHYFVALIRVWVYSLNTSLFSFMASKGKRNVTKVSNRTEKKNYRKISYIICKNPSSVYFMNTENLRNFFHQASEWKQTKFIPCLCYENLAPTNKQLPFLYCVRTFSKRPFDEKLSEVSERKGKIEKLQLPLTPRILYEILPGHQLMLCLLLAGKLQEKLRAGEALEKWVSVASSPHSSHYH